MNFISMFQPFYDKGKRGKQQDQNAVLRKWPHGDRQSFVYSERMTSAKLVNAGLSLVSIAKWF